jgi:hypothetical protein
VPICLISLLLAAPPPAAPPSLAARVDGMALSLYYEDPAAGMTFLKMVDEIAETGASHVSIIVQWGQPNVHASKVAPYPGETTADAVVRSVMQRARARGLRVLLFPILWVEKRSIGEWRGTLAPTDLDAWWVSYRRFILHYARMASEEGASIFSVGSELASHEAEEVRWRRLIGEVRGVFAGRLLYSANWDHYAAVPFWDAVDLIGLTAYYRLTDRNDASEAELTAAWGKIKTKLLKWQATIKRPILFTELGYPSLDGGARAPWDYTQGTAMDHEEQRRALAAFTETWAGERALAGVFFWNWWGPSDGQNTWYTIKGKPAEKVVRRWYARPHATADRKLP